MTPQRSGFRLPWRLVVGGVVAAVLVVALLTLRSADERTTTAASATTGSVETRRPSARPLPLPPSPVTPVDTLDKDLKDLYMRLHALSDLLVANGDSAIVGHQIRSFLLEEPDASNLVLEILDEGVDHESATTLVFELGKAGTPQAQSVLAAIYSDDDRSTRLRRQALIAAGGVAEPTADTRASLWEIYSAASGSTPSLLGPAALLGMGRIGGTLRSQEADAYSEERSRLVSVLTESRDERTTMLALKALGNTHDSSLLPSVATYLDDASARIRAVAAEVLGRLGGPEASSLLLDRLLTEQIGWVRRNVVVGIRNLSEPSQETLATISALLPKEPDDTVRAEMLLVLAKNGSS